MPEGLEYYTQTAVSLHNGGDREDPQIFQAIVKPASSETVEIVTWAAGSNDAWSKSTLTETAKDFESRNPVYIVLGGINGDFFDINNTYQPCNNFISNGDVWKKDCIKPTIDPVTHEISLNDGYGVLGFKADGSYVLGSAYANDYMSLKLLNGKVVTDEYTIEKINAMPDAEGGIALFYPGASNINVTGYTVYKGNYEFYRVSCGGDYVGNATRQPLGSFVKGTIAEVSTSLITIPTVENGFFYLVSKNAQLAEKLVVGQGLMCEYSMKGEFADVINSTGFSLQCLKNGQPIQAAGTDANYHVNTNPRSLVGFKADGSVVFMTIDGRQYNIGAMGCSTYEAGEFLRQFGCINGFNLDGGGSVTSITRNKQGGFDVMNHPSDISERELGNALLFVMRDPKINATDVGLDAITVEQTGPVASGTIQNVRVKISGGGLGSGQYQNMTDSKIVFSNLSRDTKYTISYTYEIVDEFGNALHSGVSETDVVTLGKSTPGITEFEIARKQGTTVSLDYKIEIFDEETNIIRKYIAYGDLKYDLEDNEGRAVIQDLTAGEDYEFKLVVEYDISGETKTMTSDPVAYQVSGGTTAPTGCQMGSAFGFLGLSSMLAIALFALRHRK
jgi:hypothetical protein